MATRSLGTLTLDLVAKIGGFEQGMDKAGRAAKKMADEQERAARRASKAVEGTIVSLEKQVATLGMSAEEQKLYELAINGATEAQIDQARAALDAISAFDKQAIAAADAAAHQERLAKESADLSASIDADVQSLTDEAATLGKTAKQQKLYELATKGATEEQLKQASAALTSIENYHQMQRGVQALQIALAATAAGIVALTVKNG